MRQACMHGDGRKYICAYNYTYICTLIRNNMITKESEHHHSIGSLIDELTQVRRPIEIMWAVAL